MSCCNSAVLQWSKSSTGTQPSLTTSFCGSGRELGPSADDDDTPATPRRLQSAVVVLSRFQRDRFINRSPTMNRTTMSSERLNSAPTRTSPCWGDVDLATSAAAAAEADASLAPLSGNLRTTLLSTILPLLAIIIIADRVPCAAAASDSSVSLATIDPSSSLMPSPALFNYFFLKNI